ncbi:MAG: pyridoxal-phosphate dependent enzyme [Thermoprotei archaeon]
MEICMRCGYVREDLELRCKKCGGPFKVVVDFPFVKDNLRANFPYIKEWITLGEFNTPMIKKNNVWFKLDSLNPTGSYKDRGAVTLISYLKQRGVKRISEDSSGNAGASIAAYSAAAGIEVEIYVPENVVGVKAKQIELYGAKIIKVKGSREDVAKAAELSGAYYASHILQPHFRDGIRSLAYEIVRDLGWNVPDYFFIPTSAGTLLLGVYEGFKHLLNNGIIEIMPKIISVQTEQVMPVCAKIKEINYTPPTKITSIADALISTQPYLLNEMVKILKETGECIVVNDEEIIDAHRELAKNGILVEYSSATVYAAYKKMKIKDENVVLHITGNGLKTIKP